MCGIALLSVGFISTRHFYWNRVAGIEVPYGIDVLVPKLTINPPNISIILYSMGVIIVCYYIFKVSEKYIKNRLLTGLSCLGRYSLDIFLWHIFIQQELNNVCHVENIWVKRMIYYLAMIGIPVFLRKGYDMLKKNLYEVLKA